MKKVDEIIKLCDVDACLIFLGRESVKGGRPSYRVIVPPRWSLDGIIGSLVDDIIRLFRIRPIEEQVHNKLDILSFSEEAILKLEKSLFDKTNVNLVLVGRLSPPSS